MDACEVWVPKLERVDGVEADGDGSVEGAGAGGDCEGCCEDVAMTSSLRPLGGRRAMSTRRAWRTALEKRGPMGVHSVFKQFNNQEGKKRKVIQYPPNSLSKLSTTITLSGLL